MASLNKVMLIGNLGREPEIRMAGSTKVSNFSIAVTERFRDRDGNQQEKTEWVNIVCWGNLADISEKYLHKGSSIYIEGKLETRSWDDKSSGEKKFRTEVRVLNFQMLGGRNSEQSNNDNASSVTDYPKDDDLPF